MIAFVEAAQVVPGDLLIFGHEPDYRTLVFVISAKPNPPGFVTFVTFCKGSVKELELGLPQVVRKVLPS